MMEASVWIVTYKGQTESVYTWVDYNYQSAVWLMKELQEEFPNREWSIEEKDVS